MEVIAGMVLGIGLALCGFHADKTSKATGQPVVKLAKASLADAKSGAAGLR